MPDEADEGRQGGQVLQHWGYMALSLMRHTLFVLTWYVKMNRVDIPPDAIYDSGSKASSRSIQTSETPWRANGFLVQRGGRRRRRHCSLRSHVTADAASCIVGSASRSNFRGCESRV